MKTIRIAGYLAAIMLLIGVSAHGQAIQNHARTQAVLSTSLALDVDGKVITLSLAELQAMPQKTITVHNPHTKMDESYSGVELSDLLAKYGAAFDKTSQKRLLHSYLRVEGTDGYFVLYSADEVEGAVHNGDVIVATAMNGKGLGEDGKLKLISIEDKKPMRWVRNVTKIALVTVN